MNTNTPKLSMYHANAKGTGSALSLELVPATPECEGHIAWRLAPQKGSGAPAFNWAAAIDARLHLVELAEVLRVFRGEQESIEDGKGIFIRTPESTIAFRLAHVVEPRPGYVVEMFRYDIPNGGNYSEWICLTHTEALGLALVIEQSLSRVVFG